MVDRMGSPVRARAVWVWFALCLSVVLGSCSSSQSSDDDRDEAPDASVVALAAPELGNAPLTLARALVAGDAELSARLAARVDGFTATPRGLVSPGFRGAVDQRAHHVGAILAPTADATIAAGIGVSPSYRLRLRPDGATAARASLVDGAVVYPDAYAATDLLVVAEPARVEWLYLLKDASAPSEFSYAVELPEKLVKVERDLLGRWQFHDPEGNPLLRVPEAYAVDARGERRAVAVDYAAGRLSFRLDVTGLEHPIVLDPALETAVWTIRSTPPPGRSFPGMGYDPVRQRIVLYGGQGLTDTWEWDGEYWILRSGVGPTTSGSEQPLLVWDSVRQYVLMYLPASRQTWSWDGSVWTNRCSAACATGQPSARTYSGFAFDAVRGNAILFGGHTGTTYYNETWRWDGTAWTQLAVSGPSGRTQTSLAWDATNSRVVLFGGTTNGLDSGTLADTWTWNGTAWSSLSTTAVAGHRYHMMTWDPDKAVVLLHGGVLTTGQVAKDTWELSGSTWTQRADGPSNIYTHSMAYDAARHRAVVFGGSIGQDTLLWNGTSWGSPTRYYRSRLGHGFAYDTSRNRGVLFGGSTGSQIYTDTWEWSGSEWAQTCTSAGCSATVPGSSLFGVQLAYRGDVANSVEVDNNKSWVWSGVLQTWTQLASAPTVTSQYGMAYDTTRLRAVLFGGFNGAAIQGNTWELAGSAWSQVCTTAPCSTTKPVGRFSPGMAYDATRQRTVLFGGQDASAVNLSDTWEWTGTAWIQMCTTAPCSTTKPPARYAAAMAWDATRKRTVLFGGLGGTTLQDTWEWDGSTWTLMASTGPAARRSHAMAYDPSRHTILMTGGTGVRADTWEYTTHGGTCQNPLNCGTGFCTDSVCCDSLSCGTCQACDGTTPGVCSTVVNADDLDSCTGNNTCDGAGQCKKKAGRTCSAASECASGFCADGYCCNAACSGGCDRCDLTPGTCTNQVSGSTGTNPPCGGYLCGGAGACPTSCTTDVNCSVGYFCAADGSCQPKRPQGVPCNTGAGGDCKVAGCSECTTGQCADFVCCQTACGGTCQACAAGSGLCTTLTSGQDPGTCSGTNQCSTGGACKAQTGQSCASGTDCASGFCSDSVCCNSACSGGCDSCSTGTCTVLAAGTTGAGCGNYLCGGSANCPTTCSTDAGCPSSYYCRTSDGTCQPDLSNGGVCSASSQCASGFCIDGFCCNNACSGACNACNGGSLAWPSASNGTCATAPAGDVGSPACGAYACDGTATTCSTTCTSDLQCSSGNFCASGSPGACLPQKTQGQSCNTTTDCKTAGCRECSTSNCVDGYCCNSACGGACDVCGSTPGTCTPAPGGSSGAPSCGSYTCNGSSASCPATCSADAQCSSGNYCRTSDGTCQPKLAQGNACTATVQCQTGLSCADGYCCNSGCAGLCEACNNARTGAANGTCAAVTNGTDPDSECSVDPTTSCQQDGFCNGARACRKYVSGTTCGSTTCAGTTQTNYTCNGGGTCLAGGVACGTGYACNGATGTCNASCTGDAQCAGGYYCRTSDGTCQSKIATGASCTGASQCSTGNCVDGYCCDAPCSGACQACSASKTGGSNGTCAAISTDTDPDGECAASAASTCGLNGNCDGVGACKLWPSGTGCGTNSCAAGISTGQQCNGSGACVSGSSSPCAAGYTCLNATSCATSCTSDAQCAGAYYCRVSDSTCQPDQANGAACASAAQCSSGNCVDGLCCDAPCAGSCQACSAAKKGSGANGVCGAVKVDTDPDAECAADGANPCGQTGSCDGVGSCKLALSGVICGATTCTSAVQTGQQCNGSGQCTTGTSVQCAAGYVCASPTVCATTCTTDAQCAAAYFCRTSDGTCQPDQATGQTCSGAGQCVSGNCVDGFCCDGACTSTCQACSSAKTGLPNGQCRAVQGDTDPDAECTASSSTSCGFTGNCDGVGACKFWQSGTVCGTTSCAGGVQTGQACNGSGACGTGASAPCASGYTCLDSSVCAVTCAADAQCAVGYWCRTTDHTCQAAQGNGFACSGTRQCSSGNCVDGLCCDGACSGGCQACSAAKKGAGSDGTCGPVKADSDPDAECAADGANACGQTGNCDGVGACKLATSGTICGSTTCSNAVQTGQQCNGSGQCVSGTSVQCAAGYVCASGSVCATSCTGDGQCAPAYHCSGSLCEGDSPNGGACSRAAECTSGNCVDGVCCDAPCTGACQACSAAKTGGSSGTCAPVSTGTDPDNECAASSAATCGTNGVCDGVGACKLWPSGTVCGTTSCASGVQTGQQCNGSGGCATGGSAPCATGYTCLDSSVCAAACASDSQCTASYWCRSTDGTCQQDQANGAACGASSQCASGNCVDGVCCDAPCSGACQACSASKTGASSGTCAPVSTGTDPDNECAADPQSGCQQNGSCDGAGACRKWPFGTTCGSSTCAGAVQTGQVCDGTGTCVSGSSASCSTGYACANGSTCAVSCTSDAQCAANFWCRVADGTCQPDQASGGLCGAATQCLTGNCVDGVCCDAPCSGTCQACSAAKKGQGADGTCGAVKVATDPDNECTATAASGCGTTGSCDGAGACQVFAQGTGCGATTCSGGTQTGNACDGFGTCKPASQSACTPYVCRDTSTCATSCVADADCVAGAYCDSSTGTCRVDQTNGGACTGGGQCLSGFCVDGVCCAQACLGLCQACSATVKGYGTDGVCEAIGSGTDPQSECSDDGPASCRQSGWCNGFGACSLYAAGTACGATTCTPSATGGVQTGYTCNGSGTCVAAASSQCAPYTCQGASCGATCVGDADCVATSHCRITDGTCEADLPVGSTCTADTQCSGGHCVDGVCCDAACAGTCQACSTAKTGAADGTCSAVLALTDPDDDCSDEGAPSCGKTGLCNGSGGCALYAPGTACGVTTCAPGASGDSQTGYSCNGLGTCSAGQSTACSPYTCRGSACGSSCTGDTECIAAAFCAPDATCKADLPNGGACSAPSQCVSGNCVDGVCCDQACAGTCQACTAAKKGSGADGSCASVGTGADPDNECAQELPASCGQDGSCDGSGACRRYQPGTACGPNSCSGGTGSTLQGAQCDGFGGCQASTSTTCDPYTCTGSDSCRTACSGDTDCVPGYFCTAGSTCAQRGGNGASCTADRECQSGFCVEGLCCNTACNGKCQACAQANKADSSVDGLCGNARAGADPHNDCDVADVTTCGLDGSCDGAGACRTYVAGVACGSTACNGNVQTGYACNGTGTCNSNSTTDCGLFACAGGACKTACAADGDCADDAYCETATSLCALKDPNGASCSTAATCRSGYCVDGVCCDQACSGQCQACDVSTARGTCSPVSGPPHGARPACAAAPGSTPDELCQARTCAGSEDVNTCVGFVGSDVGCRDQECASGTQTFSAACDGKGTCGTGDGGVTVKRCAPFVCADDKQCADACSSDADCAAGNRCDLATGECVSSTTCDGDHTLTNASGETTDCAPFRCTQAGDCIERCTATEDCVASYVCNADRVCVGRTNQAPAQDTGCGCRVPGSGAPRGAPAAALLLGLIALARRAPGRADPRKNTGR